MQFENKKGLFPERGTALCAGYARYFVRMPSSVC